MEHQEDDEFEKTDAGASLTYPLSAGSLKKGSYVVINGHPCKIVDISTAKTGKHGHAKASIVGIDIFTDKKYEDSCPTSHNMDVPNVARKEYSLVDVSPDNFVTLLKEDGTTKEDLKLPDEPEFKDMVDRLVADFKGGKDLLLTVVSALGIEKILSYRENQST